MTRLNQQLVLRMFDHGYSDEAIAQRLRYDIEKVQAVREKAQNTNTKLKINDDKKYR